MKVKILHSVYSCIQIGMIGEAEKMPQGYRVTFENIQHIVDPILPSVAQRMTFWFADDEIQPIIEDEITCD